jgi:hypothetical protein
MTALRYIAHVEEDGSLTLPEGVLEELGAKPGDDLEIAFQPLPQPEAKSDNGHGGDPKTLADLFKGRVGGIRSGGQGRWSENGGEKFIDYLVQKQKEGRL